MKIELIKEQYKNLVMMSDLAAGMLGILADHIEDEKYEKMSDEAEETKNYLLSFAKDFGCGDLVENWKGKTILSDKASEEFQEIMDDFDDFILFDSLANKLAWRDFKKTYSKEEIKKMAEKNGGYFCVGLYDYEKKYWDEFEKYDCDRLEIKENKK